MVESYDTEVLEAKRLIMSLGFRVDDFSFAYRPMPPDPENPGMFLSRYEIDVEAAALNYQKTFTGGAGLYWVDRFASHVERCLKKK